MRVVLDTGILLAALITSGTPPDLIFRAWRKMAFELITSEWQLEEFRLVSRYPKLRKYLKPVEAGTLVNGLRRRASALQELPKGSCCQTLTKTPYRLPQLPVWRTT